MKRVLVPALVAFLAGACGSDGGSPEGDEVVGPETVAEDMLSYPDIWSASVDMYGSSYEGSEPLVEDGKVDITFTIAKKASEDEWPYAELICKPGLSLRSLKAVSVRYRSEVDLAIKLSQSDFGFEGNESYAHYQHVLEATDEVVSRTVEIGDFAQPSWADDASRAIPLELGNVDAIYVVPVLDYEVGQSGRFELESFVLEE